METFLILIKIYKFLSIILQKWCTMTNASLNPIQWNIPTSNRELLFGECVSKSVSLWVGAGRHIPIIFHHVIWNIPWHILMTFQNIPWQKYIPPHQPKFMSSMPCGFVTWTFDNNVFVHSNINIEFYQGWCPMSWSKKNVFSTFIKNLAPWFQTCPMWQNIIWQHKHILHYQHNIQIFLPHHLWSLSLWPLYGKQIKHGWNMNLSTKHKWYIFWWLDIIIIYKIQKKIDKRYFNYSNNMIVKQLF